MKDIKEIKKIADTTTGTNTYDLDEFDTAQGSSKGNSIPAMRRKVAFVQRNRRRKARKQRIAAFAVTACVAVAAIAAFCIFGIPALNKQAGAPAATTASVSTQAKKTSTDKNNASAAKTAAQTNSNTAAANNDSYNSGYNTTDNNTNYVNTDTNTYTDSNTNTNTDDSNANVVQPYNGGKIGDDKNDVSVPKTQQVDNGVNVIDNNKPADNTVSNTTDNAANNTANTAGSNDDVNVVQPFIG